MFVFHLILLTALIVFAIKYFRFQSQRRGLVEAIDKIPGPNPRLPLLFLLKEIILSELALAGNQFDRSVLNWGVTIGLCKAYANEGIFKYWLGSTPIVHVFAPDLIEPLITSKSIIDKSELYTLLEPWLGEGLVTSRGNKWRMRRKMITPAFHFNILNDFLPIIDAGSSKWTRKLARQEHTNWFNVTTDMGLCTLDVICQTAMGVSINFDTSEGKDYVYSMDLVTKLSVNRIYLPWLHWDALYYRTANGRKFVDMRDSLHAFAMRVIIERKSEWQRLLESNKTEEANDKSFDQVIDSKVFKESGKQLAFLDLLIYQHLAKKNITLEGVREEVDTFMFAGHDTTSNTLSWALYLLGLYPDVQSKCRAELDEVFSNDLDEQEEHIDGTNNYLKINKISNAHLAKMKYIELVIKETLRMMPTVPFISRDVTEDIRISEKYVIPKGAVLTILISALHNNPKIFPHPERFEPERFSAENSLNRHPYAYVPFSAGPRNCIGQRFAMMEMKCILAKVVRNYIIESRFPLDKLRIVGEVVLKSSQTTPLQVRLTPHLIKTLDENK